MRVPHCLLVLLPAIALAGCGPSPQATDAQVAPAAASRDAVPAEALVATPWTLPTPDGAAQPDLVVAPDGSLLLSWIEPEGDGHALRFARHDDGAWSASRTIARGDDWFVNWADTPHVAATADGALWAHWLRKSAAATYAYDVVLARSGDGGATWSKPLVVNDDGTPTEHGFASLWAAGPDSIGIAWLDGRATAGGHGGHGGGHGGGAMTLRTLRLDAALARHDETRLDASTCDCCQTSAAVTADGLLLAYRDRTADEVRDIAVARHDGARWTAPRIVHADDWTMPACPVNGPAVAARGDDAVVAWYTGAGGAPRVHAARSEDAGRTFAAPVELDTGAAVLGRVDVALDERGAWVAWLREDGAGQALRLARLQGPSAAPAQAIDVARVAGRGRGTGMPQLVSTGDRLHLVWTDVVDGQPRLRGATVGRPGSRAGAAGDR